MTITEVWHFLGATGFYRQFIKGYAKLAKLLNDLLGGDNSKMKSEKVELSPEATKTFEMLKMKCLAFANFGKSFFLETDASKDGLGACCPRNKTTSSIIRSLMPVEHFMD